MQVKIKKLHPNAVIPQYAKAGDAGLDLTSVDRKWLSVERCWEYSTGLALEIPPGFMGLIFPRSSIYKKTLVLSNSVGLVDAGYRGEIKFKFKESSEIHGHEYIYDIGDRVGQLVIIPFPQIELIEVDELSDSERGTGGWGSSGN